MSPLVMTRHIAAPPATVFSFLVDPEKLVQWIGVSADLDVQVGGKVRIDVTGGTLSEGRVVEGEYVEITPHRRVAFTWGWSGDAQIPSGSTTVTFDLAPVDGSTRLTLTHTGLPFEEPNRHGQGWTYFLRRLGVAAAGGSPGAIDLAVLGTTETILTLEENP